MANALFAILHLSNPAAVTARLTNDVAPWVWRELQDGQFLLVAPNATTTQEVSDRLQITKGESGTGVVLRIENYYGRAPVSIWEWIATKQGADLAAQT